MTNRMARIIIITIWIYSCLLFLPWLIHFKVVPFEHSGAILSTCTEDWEPGIWFFVVVVFVLCYWLPLIIISASYLKIYLHVIRRSIPGEMIRENEKTNQRQKIKLTKMVAIVVLMFALSWLPLYTVFICIFFKWLDPTSYFAKIMVPFVQWLSVSNSSVNPILYAWLNRKYRKGFLILLTSRSCCGHLRWEDAKRKSTRSYTTTTVELPSHSSLSKHDGYQHRTFKL